MENDKIKFRIELNQLFAGNGIGQIPHFQMGISPYIGDLSDIFSR
jgi:hypothetical protein